MAVNKQIILAALEASQKFLREAANPMPIYGFFHGGDPRDFSPDPDASTEEERAAHKAACDAFTEDKPLPGCCEHVIGDDGKTAMILTKAPFGLGVNTYSDPEAEKALTLIDAALKELN